MTEKKEDSFSFVKLPSWVLDASDLSSDEVRLLAIAFAAKHNWKNWTLRRDDICRRMNVSKGTYDKVVSSLAAKNILVKFEKKRFLKENDQAVQWALRKGVEVSKPPYSKAAVAVLQRKSQASGIYRTITNKEEMLSMAVEEVCKVSPEYFDKFKKVSTNKAICSPVGDWIVHSYLHKMIKRIS